MNILFIAIDTLRADHLGCYGCPRPTSPHLDALAERGVLFEHFTACHIPTHPGYTTLFTGKDVFSHQLVAQSGQVELSGRHHTLPQILQKQGYFTAAADNLGHHFTRGYDVYEGYQWEQDAAVAWRKAEAVNATAQRVLSACESQDKPWYCFVHYWDPHTPYLPPPPFDRMFYAGDEKDPVHTSAYEMMHNYPAFQYYFQSWMPGLTDVEFPKAQYAAEVAYADTCLAHLLQRVGTLPGGEDTAIVVTADHGEELDEHQMWFDHHGLYETNLHVPLIMYHPERLAGGARRGGLTRHQDLAPTILDLVGLGALATEEEMDGQSLLPLVDGRSDAGTAEMLYATECGWMKKRALRTARYKYIESLYDELHKRPPFELYDLTTDPGEQCNLADKQPDILADFRGRMAAHIERRVGETGLPNPHDYQEITMTQVGRPPDPPAEEKG